MNCNMALKPQFLNYIWNTGTIKSNKKAIIYPDIQSQIFYFSFVFKGHKNEVYILSNSAVASQSKTESEDS